METYLCSRSSKAYQRMKVQNTGLVTKKKEKMIDGWGCTCNCVSFERQRDQKRTW